MTKLQKLKKEVETRCKSCIHYVPYDKKKEFNICKAGILLYLMDNCFKYKKNIEPFKFSCIKCAFYEPITKTCHCGMYVRTISDAFIRQHKCLYEKDYIVSNLKENLKRYKEYVKKITTNLKDLKDE